MSFGASFFVNDFGNSFFGDGKVSFDDYFFGKFYLGGSGFKVSTFSLGVSFFGDFLTVIGILGVAGLGGIVFLTG